DKGWDARKRAYCLKIQPATGSFARNLIYSTKPIDEWSHSTLRKNGIENYSVERISNELKSERTPANYSDDARKLFILHERVCLK
ncbi:hypothetical protein, partial [Escherichia coli]